MKCFIESEAKMHTKWVLTEEERDNYIDALKEDLTLLRAKANISQTDLCNIIGLSRQSYSAIESGKKKMVWTTYLSLIAFYDNNLETRDILRGLKGYPAELFRRINNGKNPDVVLFGSEELNKIFKQLDDQALHSLRTLILVEYARCKKIPGDAVVKSFDGKDFFGKIPDEGTEAALKRIQKRIR